MLPFLRKMPSIDMSECAKKISLRRQGVGTLLTHLLHRGDDILEERRHLEVGRGCAKDRVRSSTLDKLVKRDTKDAWRVVVVHKSAGRLHEGSSELGVPFFLTSFSFFPPLKSLFQNVFFLDMRSRISSRSNASASDDF